jgi:hypothetical protein
MEQADQQAILSDVKKRFELTPEQIALSELHPASFPPDAKLFRAEKRGSHGNIYYNYIKFNQDLYCSADENSFARLLSAGRLLESARWNAHQVATLFLHLVVRNLKLVESAQELHLTADSPLKERAEQVSPPSLEIKTSGAQAHFWTYMPRNQKLERWQVKVSSDYKVSYQRD